MPWLYNRDGLEEQGADVWHRGSWRLAVEKEEDQEDSAASRTKDPTGIPPDSVQPGTLLEMLAEQWEESKDEEKDLLTYIKDRRDNLHSLWEEAHSTLREAQAKQKAHYDVQSTSRRLKAGDKVLVLLPTSENKLLARWQGPYNVLEQVNPTTYKFEIPRGTGREQIYHINLFKKWYDQRESHTSMYITTEGDLEIPLYDLQYSGQGEHPMPQIINSLNPEQQKQLEHLVHSNLDVFSKIPSRTSLIQHPIRTIGNKVVRQQPYRIPEAK
ncbi:hypothetical protein NDU88_013326 [Pleurodeles waltl]|uniref:Uncharacterized protein n=1 Tax=Pleurodeles waltl TaxID=8319 RepID=A0AAV7R796_PLEWA|nr:hypothetical protein NDU88_013326 [Pleurodeles waltl]